MKRLFTKLMVVFVVVLSIVMCPMDKVHADEVMEFTKNIAIGTTVEDTLSTGNGRYNFRLNRSGTLTVQIGFKEGSSYSWGSHGGITLYDCDGAKIEGVGVFDGTDGTDSGVFTVDVLAGDYYFIVDRKGSAASNYVITTSYIDSCESVVDSLLDTHGSQANPITLTLGRKKVGHIANNSADDVYQLVMKKSQVLKLNVTNRTNSIYVNIVNTNNTVNQKIKIEDKAGTIKLFCPAGTYYITMSRYANNGVYTISASASDIPTTKISKVKNVQGKYMSVKYKLKSTEDVAGYQIQYSTNKKFKKGKKNVYITNSNYLKSTYTFYVGKKKTYYVRMRTYVEDNRGDRYYSKWSSAKKVKIKK